MLRIVLGVTLLIYGVALPSQSLTQSWKRSSGSSSSRLRRAWYDDDLPNILGINPIEAAVIGGALYYFYGPTVLYEYAREAGRLFSTYAPVVKSISQDIFFEFRDYLEEDRERESLRKQGVKSRG
jgi:hypothetical protein